MRERGNTVEEADESEAGEGMVPAKSPRTFSCPHVMRVHFRTLN